jgi:hypothetical protein
MCLTKLLRSFTLGLLLLRGCAVVGFRCGASESAEPLDALPHAASPTASKTAANAANGLRIIIIPYRSLLERGIAAAH